MDTTVLLSKIFGVYLLIAAAIVFFNRKALMLAVTSMFKERFAQLIAAMVSIVGGLTFINVYQDWSTLPGGIISAFAWLILLKGLTYAFLPQAHLAKLTGLLSERGWYTMDGVLSLVIGVYLAGYGYGVW